MTLVDGSALPGSIAFVNNEAKISIFENDYLLTAFYLIKIVVSDPKTGQQN